MIGTNGSTDALQGYSVALSADGNTALVGGPYDNGQAGAVWVYIRSGGAWSQQGAKLTVTDNVSNARFGWAVALSADGNTALIGGPADNTMFGGAAWVFTRSGGVWSEQAKRSCPIWRSFGDMVLQGTSVALSADSNTAEVGAPQDASLTGPMAPRRAVDFTRSGSAWGEHQLIAGRSTRRLQPLHKALRLRCPPTATPRRWEPLVTITATPPTARYLLLPAATGCGPNKAAR